MSNLLQPEQLYSLLPRLSLPEIEAEIARREAERTRKASIEADRAACTSLSEFIKRAWHVIEPGMPYKHNWHADAIAEHLEAVFRGDIRRLIINVPPGTSKSSLVGVFFPMWVWGPMNAPHTRFLGVAHEQTLGVRDNLKCRRLVMSEWFQERWPVAITSDQNEKLNFENVATGFRSVATPANITGRRANCLVGSTLVRTERGEERIDSLIHASSSCDVLSYDADTHRLVYRPIQAVARRTSPDFYRVHTAGGSVVECTGDHRIYTARGYVEARLLSPGDVLLRSVRHASETQYLPDEEGGEEGLQKYRMQLSVRADFNQHQIGQDGAELPDMRRESRQIAAVLFRAVQEVGKSAPAIVLRLRRAGAVLRDLWQNLPSADSGVGEPLLFQGLQERRPFFADEGKEQSRLARRSAWIAKPVPSIPKQSQTIAPLVDRPGRWLRGLFDHHKYAGSPHRYEGDEQSPVQSRDPMQGLPHGTSRSGESKTVPDTVAMVERVHEPVDVFDIQVAETHCFFANGILVHNCVIVDDPVSVENANSVVEREKVNQWFAESLPTRLNDPERSAIVLVMQRVHEDDPTGMILSKGWGWDTLVIPMEFDPARRHKTSIGWTDPRTRDGELLFPERFPQAVVDEYKRTLGAYAYAGQFQQIPVPREGAMFKKSWFTPLKAIPAGTRFVRYWDLAATEAQFGSDPDYTVGLKLGRMPDGRYVVADVNRLRAEGTGVRRMIKDTAREDGPFTEIGLPQDPGQAGKTQAQDMIAMLSGYVARAIRETGDKTTRAEPIAAQAEAGNLCYLDGQDWAENFFSELTTFPGSKHKDQVDALSGAFSMLMRSNMFGVPEADITIDPVKVASLWSRVAAIDVSPTHVSVVFAAFNQAADIMMVYDSIEAPRLDLAILASMIRAKHPPGLSPGWIPVLFDMTDHGRKEDEGIRIAEAVARLGVEVMTADLDMEAGISQMAERLASRRLRVFSDQQEWFAQYRRFTRDEKGVIAPHENGIMRATGLIALHGRDVAVTEQRALSDQQGHREALSTGRRSAAGY